MHIIQAELIHLDTLVPLFDQYRQFYQKPTDPMAARDYLQARLSQEESTLFLALDGQNQGMGFTQLYPSFCSVEMYRIWILYDLFVAPSLRQQGVGAALLHRARRLAAESSAERLELQTGTDNYAAQALYEKLGYRRQNDFNTYTYTFK